MQSRAGKVTFPLAVADPEQVDIPGGCEPPEDGSQDSAEPAARKQRTDGDQRGTTQALPDCTGA